MNEAELRSMADAMGFRLVQKPGPKITRCPETIDWVDRVNRGGDILPPKTETPAADPDQNY